MALVMVMEDEPNIALVLEIALTEEGNEVITLPNGLLGLERLKQKPAPEIIFVDLNMPILSGRTVIEKINADPNLRHIPVVILSGCMPDLDNAPPRESYRALLSKPFDLDEVINMVNVLSAGKQQAV
ncbi:response regulator [Pelotomaculum isophthalicicum JI]|uniref:Stage 0 sporulation protein A homolog n=1 Tax=Pelotomaculum isophthalicicum JI TaxID=947010 RepID=A0A9X4JT80_9FIRM|nr:response regulator [Pelotomaculum isophthalicicum]MDF9407030.1 response regulator [Pelotomaculum isophthalicicum JI]